MTTESTAAAFTPVRAPGKPPRAFMVFDGDTLRIPPHWPAPLPDQMQGTKYEQLIELAGRTCYDSLGADADGKRKGRPSLKFHDHLIEVNHGSVLEHVNINLMFNLYNLCSYVYPRYTPLSMNNYFLMSLANRKGVSISSVDGVVYVSANVRAIAEWSSVESRCRLTNADEASAMRVVSDVILGSFAGWINRCMPTVDSFLKKHKRIDLSSVAEGATSEHVEFSNKSWHHTFASFFLHGSRGYTHEQIRHRFAFTADDESPYLDPAISQRSTRFVNESESDYLVHDLIDSFLHDPSVDSDERREMVTFMTMARHQDNRTYNHIYQSLYRYLVNKGVDKTTARKQSLGAAREHLAHALPSEMIYTLSIHDWRGVIRQRLNPAADAQIRGIYAEVLHEFKASNFAHFFTDMDFAPSPDGIGVVLKESAS